MFKQTHKAISIAILIAFISASVQSPAYAQVASVDQMPFMPKPGAMVPLSPEYTPAYLKGIVIHPENALKFDFIIYKGDKPLSDAQKKEEYTKLTKYFLASLAIPDDDQWVNLSPYEKDRIIKDDFGKTEMGRDLLAQDYLLKQITASLIYPQDSLGKKFWDKVYTQAQKQYGTTNIPVNTFNKVWILPDDALIYEKGNTAYVLKNHLRVMLEEDYLAISKHEVNGKWLMVNGQKQNTTTINNSPLTIHQLGSQIIRQIILPELQREVNEDKNFAPLRQVYSGMLLATWFKRTLKESLLGQIYANKAKVKGIDQDPKTNEEIYRRYLQAYKKGVFNFIKEDVNKYTNETIPRKYFSGGTTGFKDAAMILGYDPAKITHSLDFAQRANVESELSTADLATVAMSEDRAMNGKSTLAQAQEEYRLAFLDVIGTKNQGFGLKIMLRGIVVTPKFKRLIKARKVLVDQILQLKDLTPAKARSFFNYNSFGVRVPRVLDMYETLMIDSYLKGIPVSTVQPTVGQVLRTARVEYRAAFLDLYRLKGKAVNGFSSIVPFFTEREKVRRLIRARRALVRAVFQIKNISFEQSLKVFDYKAFGVNKPLIVDVHEIRMIQSYFEQISRLKVRQERLAIWFERFKVLQAYYQQKSQEPLQPFEAQTQQVSLATEEVTRKGNKEKTKQIKPPAPRTSVPAMSISAKPSPTPVISRPDYKERVALVESKLREYFENGNIDLIIMTEEDQNSDVALDMIAEWLWSEIGFEAVDRKGLIEILNRLVVEKKHIPDFKAYFVKVLNDEVDGAMVGKKVDAAMLSDFLLQEFYRALTEAEAQAILRRTKSLPIHEQLKFLTGLMKFPANVDVVYALNGIRALLHDHLQEVRETRAEIERYASGPNAIHGLFENTLLFMDMQPEELKGATDVLKEIVKTITDKENINLPIVEASNGHISSINRTPEGFRSTMGRLGLQSHYMDTASLIFSIFVEEIAWQKNQRQLDHILNELNSSEFIQRLQDFLKILNPDAAMVSDADVIKALGEAGLGQRQWSNIKPSNALEKLILARDFSTARKWAAMQNWGQIKYLVEGDLFKDYLEHFRARLEQERDHKKWPSVVKDSLVLLVNQFFTASSIEGNTTLMRIIGADADTITIRGKSTANDDIVAIYDKTKRANRILSIEKYEEEKAVLAELIAEEAAARQKGEAPKVTVVEAEKPMDEAPKVIASEPVQHTESIPPEVRRDQIVEPEKDIIKIAEAQDSIKGIVEEALKGKTDLEALSDEEWQGIALQIYEKMRTLHGASIATEQFWEILKLYFTKEEMGRYIKTFLTRQGRQNRQLVDKDLVLIVERLHTFSFRLKDFHLRPEVLLFVALDWVVSKVGGSYKFYRDILLENNWIGSGWENAEVDQQTVIELQSKSPKPLQLQSVGQLKAFTQVYGINDVPGLFKELYRKVMYANYNDFKQDIFRNGEISIGLRRKIIADFYADSVKSFNRVTLLRPFRNDYFFDGYKTATIYGGILTGEYDPLNGRSPRMISYEDLPVGYFQYAQDVSQELLALQTKQSKSKDVEFPLPLAQITPLSEDALSTVGIRVYQRDIDNITPGAYATLSGLRSFQPVAGETFGYIQNVDQFINNVRQAFRKDRETRDKILEFAESRKALVEAHKTLVDALKNTLVVIATQTIEDSQRLVNIVSQADLPDFSRSLHWAADYMNMIDLLYKNRFTSTELNPFYFYYDGPQMKLSRVVNVHKLTQKVDTDPITKRFVIVNVLFMFFKVLFNLEQTEVYWPAVHGLTEKYFKGEDLIVMNDLIDFLEQEYNSQSTLGEFIQHLDDKIKSIDAAMRGRNENLIWQHANLNASIVDLRKELHGLHINLMNFPESIYRVDWQKRALRISVEIAHLEERRNRLPSVNLYSDWAQMAVPGGIDMNAANLTLRIKRDGNGVPLPLAQQDLAQLNNIEGLDPVILSIKPASQTALFSQIAGQP